MACQFIGGLFFAISDFGCSISDLVFISELRCFYISKEDFRFLQDKHINPKFHIIRNHKSEIEHPNSEILYLCQMTKEQIQDLRDRVTSLRRHL